MSLPAIPASFTWIPQPWGHALRCDPLATVAPHLFTTRQLQLPEPAGWRMLADAIGVDERYLWRLSQVHGAAAVAASGPAPEPRPDADGLVAGEPNVGLAVVAADCVPLLMADARTGAVAAVHAGWRGTAARIATAAVEAMRHEFGTDPRDIVAAIGPAIGACCYEVGPELVDAFAAAGHERYLIDRWFQARPPRREEPTRAAPRLRLDVVAANRDQLILAGVSEQQIHLAGLCTAMHLDVLTSYRAEQQAATRIAGVIRPASK